MDRNSSKRSYETPFDNVDESLSGSRHGAEPARKKLKIPEVVDLTGDDDDTAHIPPARLTVDYGDRVIEMNRVRSTQNQSAFGNQMPTAASRQSSAKQSLRDRLAAAQREEDALDAHLRAQSARQVRPAPLKAPSFAILQDPSSDEDEKYFSKPMENVSRRLDRTENCSAIDLPPINESAMPVDMSNFSYDPSIDLESYTSSQAAVKHERSGPPKPRKPRAKKAKVEPELCEEQRNLVNLILSGQNVFYTGSAGCGKSTVLKAFVKELKARKQTVVICAPTGKAALEVNGCTFWTFAGWTPSHFKKPLKKLKEGAHGKFVRKKMKDVDVLIIDEISMMENHAFERLNEVMKEARGSHQAFGGVQIIVTGDFCQLPPVKPFQHCMECGRETSQRVKETVYKCPQHGKFNLIVAIMMRYALRM